MPGMTLVDPPCQVSVQPPAWLPMLSALLPATYTSCFGFSGSVRCRLRSSTWLSAAAYLATAWWSRLPTRSRWVRSVIGCSNSPSSNFAVRMRDTASSIRSSETSPDSTSWISAGMNSLQSLGWSGLLASGSMNMSTPALTAVAICSG